MLMLGGCSSASTLRGCGGDGRGREACSEAQLCVQETGSTALEDVGAPGFGGSPPPSADGQGQCPDGRSVPFLQNLSRSVQASPAALSSALKERG